MKTQIIFIFTIIALTNTQCQTNYETISLRNNVIISLPIDFDQVDDSSLPNFKTVYRSSSNSDELHISNHSFKAFDSFTIEKKEGIVESNLENIVKSYKAEKVQRGNLLITGSVIQNEYSMVVEEEDSERILYVKVVNKNSNVIILSYFTSLPPKKESQEIKERIFESILMD